MKNLHDFRKFKKKDPKKFNKLLDLCEPKAKIFWQSYGFDFRDFKDNISSEKNLFNKIHPIFQKDKKIIKKSINELIDYFNFAKQKLNLLEKDLFSINEDYFEDSSQKRNFNKIMSLEYVQKNKEFIPKENLVDLILQTDQIIMDKIILRKKTKKKNNNDPLKDFKKRYEDYIGVNTRIARSKFELKIENILKNHEIFFRTQVRYEKILPTKRKYIMDFLVGKTIIEVGSVDDCFIHNKDYWKRINHKNFLATKNGFEFLLIDELTNLEELEKLKQKVLFPSDLYEIKQEKPRILNIPKIKNNKKYFSRKNIYLASDSHSNIYMIGSLKKAI